MRKNVKKLAAIALAGALSMASVLGMSSVNASAAGELNDAGKAAKAAAKKGEIHLDEGTEYHAYLLFQAVESWVGRDRFFTKKQGVDYDHFDTLWTSLKSDKLIPLEGAKVEDAVIKGNGHYTVKVTGIDGRCTAEVAGTDPAEYGILGFTTDIPYDQGVTIDNVSVKSDGVDRGKRSGDEVYYDKDDIKDPGLITVELANSWHDECKNPLGLTLPQDSVEIGFDVKGFNYDNPDAVEATATPKAAAKDDSSKKDSKGVSTGTIVCIVVVAVVVIAGVVVVVTRKKKKE